MLHDIVGKRSEPWTIDDSENVMNLIRAISSKYGKRFDDFVFDSDRKIRPGLAFAVNGTSIQKSMLTKTKCKNVNEFVILPPISGGSKSHYVNDSKREK